jgi:DNA-binding NarL/FixJ family response regulator
LTTRPKLAEQVLQQFQELAWRSEAEGLIAPLTPREMEILNYIAKGFLNKQIAAELAISEQTIKNHVTSILRKLNANARTEAVVVALKQGLISLS